MVGGNQSRNKNDFCSVPIGVPQGILHPPSALMARTPACPYLTAFSCLSARGHPIRGCAVLSQAQMWQLNSWRHVAILNWDHTGHVWDEGRWAGKNATAAWVQEQHYKAVRGVQHKYPSLPVLLPSSGARATPVLLASSCGRATPVLLASTGARATPVLLASTGARATPVLLASTGARATPVLLASIGARAITHGFPTSSSAVPIAAWPQGF